MPNSMKSFRSSKINNFPEIDGMILLCSLELPINLHLKLASIGYTRQKQFKNTGQQFQSFSVKVVNILKKKIIIQFHLYDVVLVRV